MWAWAGKIEPASTSEAIVGPIDVYPTVIDLLGIAKPEQQVFDGVSYAKVLKGDGELKRNAYFNYHPHAGPHRAGGVWVRRGDFKLLRWFGNPGTHELYNLREDVSEARDLSATMPDKVNELEALIDGFLKDTDATYPRANPAYKPVAAKVPVQKTDPLEVWKERGCKATVSEGIVTMKSTGKPGAAFLGHGTAKMNGPATVKLRVRSEAGGAGKIDSLPNTAADPGVIHSSAFEVKAGDWQELKIEVSEKGPLGTLRVYLPDGEVDFIEVVPANGKGQRWDF